MIKIIFIGAYPPTIGRLSEFNYALVKSIYNEYKISFIVLSDKENISLQDNNLLHEKDFIMVKRCWEPDNLYSLRCILRELIRSRKLTDKLLLSIYHGIFGISALINGLFFIIIYSLLWFLRYKTITILHTVPELITLTDTRNFRLKHLIKIGLKIITWLIIEASSTIVVLSEVHKKTLCYMYVNKCNKIHYIPHGTWYFENYRKNQNFVTKTKKRFTIAYIGFIAPRKNLELLFNIVKELEKELNISIELFLIGTIHPDFKTNNIKRSFLNFLKNTLRETNNLKIKYFGYLAVDELYKVLKNVDLVILPYNTSTGTSGVVHLIAGSGTPIILPSFPEYLELYKEGAGLYLYNPIKNTYNEILSATKKLILDTKKYHELSKRNINFAYKRKWPKIAEQFFNIITNLENKRDVEAH